MNPDDYEQYALSIDFFSDPVFNESLSRYISLIVGSSPSSSKICDVGGGTGYLLNLILKQRTDLVATLIEPSKPMFYQAESSLASTKIKLVNTTLQESISTLECQDAFLFCRSLYAFSGDISFYKALFSQLTEKLSAFGQLFIYEISAVYDIALYKKRLEKNFINKKEKFKKHWPILELALQRFNEGVENGEFTLFSRDKIESLASEAGFTLLYYSHPDLYCFRKRYS
ncbi:MAG: class I SAM-dependent methyltransferase [Methylococcaceae bacterium]|nr:class I SAM-dependent methyltransferase [Methylococcaceae bacterium]